MGGDTSGDPSLFAQPGASVPLWDMTWTRTSPQVTLNHMNTPAPLDASPALGEPRRPRPSLQRLVGVLLSWLRFAAMAIVGMLGVWLLVLLFGQ